MPSGSPTLLIGNDRIGKLHAGHQPYRGFIRCKVLPPATLRLPVLPLVVDDILHYPLCYTCCKELSKNDETRSDTSCTHNIEQRSFWISSTTVEIDKALEKGYEILESSEVWHYAGVWPQYDGKDGSTGLCPYYNRY
jgi:hypothetical protein